MTNEKIMTLGDFKFKRLFCPSCGKKEWHLLKATGGWECIGCRAKEPPLESRFPHLFRDKEN